MRRWRVLVGAVLVSYGATSWSADCPAIQGAIEDDLRRAAVYDAMKEGVDDHAAYARITMTLTQVQTNVLLLIAAKCPLPEKPFTWHKYSKAAGECSIQAQLARQRREPIQGAACDAAAWKPNPDN